MKNQKTVLVISPSLGIGGRERIAINTVRCLEGLGYRAVLVLLQRRDVEYPFSGERIDLDVPARRGFFGKIVAQIQRSRKVFRLRKQHDVGFVYSLGEAANITNVLSGLTRRGKTIVAVHGFGEVKKGFLPRFVFSRADRVICISQDMGHHLLSLYPGCKQATVIENGYELTNLEKKAGTPSVALRLVTMGRLDEIKGFERLIKSVAILQKTIPDVSLTILGEGEERRALAETARRLGLAQTIRFTGYLTDPFPVLQEHDIYALTSYSEGFPNALLEALHCCLPVVAVDCHSGPREILSEAYSPEPVQGIRFEKYGVLVENSPDGFVERFAQAVIRLWQDRERMSYYREIGPERAKDFSLERYQAKLKQLLEEFDHEEQ